MAENESDRQSRTEPPSPRRRERAREEGQFAFSPELNTGLVLFAGALGLMLLAQTLGGGLLAQIRLDLSLLPSRELSTDDVVQIFTGKAGQGLAIVGTLIG